MFFFLSFLPFHLFNIHVIFIAETGKKIRQISELLFVAI